MKKLALLWVLVLALCMGTALTANAEPTVYESRDYKYTLLEDGTAKITKYNGNAADLTIPAELDGHRVTAIGYMAFGGCTSLTTVTIPDSVTYIGERAFYHCEALTSVTIPDSVTSLEYCAFCGCEALTSVTIPHSVTSIGASAFNGCKSLTSVTIPNSVTAIGAYAFSWCDTLPCVTIPGSVTSIGDGAFWGCKSLTSVTIPNSVTSIGVNPFGNCNMLTDIIVSEYHPTLTTINGVLFDKTEKRLICCSSAFNAEEYAVPQGIRIIGDDAFFNCDSLISVTIPDSVTSIGEGAFKGCFSHLTLTVGRGSYAEKFAIDNNIKYVYSSAPTTSVTIPDGVTSIGDEAFSGCKSLTSLTIPDSVTSIGGSTFNDCPHLTLTVGRGSYAEKYAIDHNLKFVYSDSTK